MTRRDSRRFGLLIGTGVGLGVGTWAVYNLPLVYVAFLVVVAVVSLRRSW